MLSARHFYQLNTWGEVAEARYLFSSKLYCGESEKIFSNLFKFFFLFLYYDVLLVSFFRFILGGIVTKTFSYSK